MAAVISVGLTYRLLPWQWPLPALAYMFAVSFLAMLPGLIAAHGLKRMSRPPSIPASKHLLDFWLPAVVGLVTFDGYIAAVTGRSSLFYLNLVIVKRAYRWLGSGGTDANFLLFLPMLLTMLLSMLVARWIHAKLRRTATIPAYLWLPCLLVTTGLVLWPYVASSRAANAKVQITTDWERPPVDSHRIDHTVEMPNVVLVIFESLRADALRSDIMPCVSSIAATGAQFHHHYAGSNSSLLGLYSLLHGRAAAHSEQDLQANTPAALLAAFKQQGYQTAFFCGGDPAGYDEMDRLLGPACFDVYGVKAHKEWHHGDIWALAQMQSCLNRSSNQPTLAILFVMSTHFDYGVERAGPFAPAASDWSLLVPWTAHGAGHDAVVNRYRNAVYQADQVVGQVLQQLRTTNAVVAITGDHGQSLYDDGTVAHWSRLSDVQTRVPLVIAGPGIQVQRVDSPTMHADVAQLLLDAARGHLSPPTPRPILLVQSNPGLDYEDWALISSSQRTAWRRQGTNVTYRGLLDHHGQLVP